MDKNVQEAVERMAAKKDLGKAEYIDKVTMELCTLSNSTLAYFATMNPAQDVLTMVGWSKSAMMNCSMIDKPIVYKLVDTGLWGDAVRENKAVITNDYPALKKPTKKGYPKGHVNVRKHMNLPVKDGGKTVLVVGVGNKKDDYTLADAKPIEEFMSAIWPTLKTKV